jgi:hypothetical protein
VDVAPDRTTVKGEIEVTRKAGRIQDKVVVVLSAVGRCGRTEVGPLRTGPSSPRPR